jgi:hypothetical protein
MVNIIDGSNSLSSRIVKALNVGASREMLHEIVVDQDGVSEEDFFLAFAAAEMLLADLEGAATVRS